MYKMGVLRLKCVLIYYQILVVNAYLIEDLEPLFLNKHCIEASLISVSHPQDAAVMIDNNSKFSTSELINITELTKSNYEKSAVSKINELAQYNEIEDSYELLIEEGPAHDRNYKVALTLGDEKYEGVGSSLKKAKKAAAALALANTFYEHPPIKLKSEEEKSLTPISLLNNIAMKLGIAVSYSLVTDQDEQAITSYGSYEESYSKSKSYNPKINSSASLRVPIEEPQLSGPFTVKVKVGDSLFLGVGHTVQAARHEAALSAMKSMEKQALYKNNACANEESVQECRKIKEGLKSPITRVYEAGQKRNLPVEFNIISDSGKSHQKVFVTECKLGDFVSVGEGSSKKESKRQAAEKMLENFSLLPEVFDGKEIINGLKTKKKKKKKKKLITGNMHSLKQSIGNMLTAFWSTNDIHSNEDKTVNIKHIKDSQKSKSSGQTSSPKDKLLELSSRLNIQVLFTDLRQYQNNFYTLMSLVVQPLHVCLGKAPTRDKSHEMAALYGLKFLHKAGILDKPEFLTETDKTYYINEEYLEEYSDMYASVEEKK